MQDNRYEFIPIRQKPRRRLDTPYGPAPAQGVHSPALLLVLHFFLRAGAAIGMSIMVLISLWVGFFALICILGNGL